MNKVTVLGATGSIGTSTLDVIRRNPDRYSLFAATARSNVSKMLAIVGEFHPDVAVMLEEKAAAELRELLAGKGLKTEVLSGAEALSAVASSDDADSVMSAIVGAAGLKPTLAAITTGKTVYLANKESLIMSGHIFVDAARRYKSRIVPVDSEHNAIFQCLPEKEQNRIGRCDLREAGITRLVLTGSGGPFRDRDIATLSEVTPEEAVSHPNWSMGRKISVDSATMMNKGFEFIEAKWLFNADPGDIEVIVHPESVIHSMVRYRDGSVLAEIGVPDMRTPIARAMAWPDRIDSGAEAIDFTRIGSLTFRSPDFSRYPCLKLAIDACYTSQALTTAVNAANEVAVQAFLDGRLRFTDIYTVAARTADCFTLAPADSLEDVLNIDLAARSKAFSILEDLGR